VSGFSFPVIHARFISWVKTYTLWTLDTLSWIGRFFLVTEKNFVYRFAQNLETVLIRESRNLIRRGSQKTGKTMPVFFNKVERPLPGQPASPKKWYAVVKTIGQVGEKEVSRRIADETTLNAKEAEMALSQFQKVLLNSLLNSRSVQLGDWGSFRLTGQSTAHDTREDVTGKSIEKLNIRFTPGKELKEAITKAIFTPTESLVSKTGTNP
jgi:predicted histone-like DNA-binding protein